MKCTKMIYGTCTGCETHSTRGVTMYYPKFEYEYNGMRYSGRSLLSIGKKESAYYQPGIVCPIWVYAKHPQQFTSRKNLRGIDILCIVVGIMLFVAAAMFSAGIIR